MAKVKAKQVQQELEAAWAHVANNESRLDLLERQVDGLVQLVADLMVAQPPAPKVIYRDDNGNDSVQHYNSFWHGFKTAFKP